MTRSPRQNLDDLVKRAESGQALITGLALMVTLIMLTALVADVGMALLGRRSIQNAADAAALAGAQHLPENTDAALAEARSYANRNGLSDDEIDSIYITTTDYPNDTLKVEVKRDVIFALAPVMNISGTSVATKAAARAGSPIGAGALAPLAVLESTFSGLAPGDPATLKYNATNASNGNFLPLAMDNTGASEYGQNLQIGSESFFCAEGHEKAGCPSVIDTEPGNVIGQTRQSLNWIFANTRPACDTFNEVFSGIDPVTGFAQLNPDCNRYTSPSAGSYRLVLVPVIKNLCDGRCQVTVVEFAMFFIESYTCTGGQGNSCDLTGRYAKADGDIQGLIGIYDPTSTSRFVRLIE
jgi:Flp pilus assembly protein TadG